MSQNTSSAPNIKRDQQKKFAKPRGPKRPRKITPSYLHNSGLYYLERFASSSANFETVMMRKVKKSCAYHTDQNYEECAEMVKALVAKFIDLELLNDDVYTRGKVRSLRARGKSKRYILGHLRQKGVGADLVQKHMDVYDREAGYTEPQAELQAALIFARKKRIGPYRKDGEYSAEKELGKMARAGFSYDTSRSALDKDIEQADTLIRI